MYSTCVWCYAELGKNETIEHFPVGRRLAFDAAKGRLWVVCRRCQRWNLTPIEERWEAIEECERRFTSTRLRVSTDEIGLVRVDDGLDLIRIGAPLRPEMASWRYSDRFARRRKTFLALTGAAVAGIGFVYLGPSVGMLAAGTIRIGSLVSMGLSTYLMSRNAPGVADWLQRPRTVPRIRIPEHHVPVEVGRDFLDMTMLGQDSRGWWLAVTHGRLDLGRVVDSPVGPSIGSAFLRGDDAMVAAGKLLPLINRRGAASKDVASALDLLNEVPNAQELFSRFAPRRSESMAKLVNPPPARLAVAIATGAERTRITRSEVMRVISPAIPATMFTGVISRMPSDVRLALEMAAHEDTERRAMEGELELLTQAWRDAAEIAAISDNMFLPETISRRIRGMAKSE